MNFSNQNLNLENSMLYALFKIFSYSNNTTVAMYFYAMIAEKMFITPAQHPKTQTNSFHRLYRLSAKGKQQAYKNPTSINVL